MGHGASSNRKTNLWQDKRFQKYLKQTADMNGWTSKEKDGTIASVNIPQEAYDAAVDKFKRMSEKERNYYR